MSNCFRTTVWYSASQVSCAKSATGRTAEKRQMDDDVISPFIRHSSANRSSSNKGLERGYPSVCSNLILNKKLTAGSHDTEKSESMLRIYGLFNDHCCTEIIAKLCLY